MRLTRCSTCLSLGSVVSGCNLDLLENNRGINRVGVSLLYLYSSLARVLLINLYVLLRSKPFKSLDHCNPTYLLGSAPKRWRRCDTAADDRERRTDGVIDSPCRCMYIEISFEMSLLIMELSEFRANADISSRVEFDSSCWQSANHDKSSVELNRSGHGKSKGNGRRCCGSVIVDWLFILRPILTPLRVRP